LIAELMDGVDAENGDLPRNVQRLLGFCLSRVAANGEAEWSAAGSILTQLRDSFRAIRDQAVQLEQSGEIPPIDLGMPEMTLAVG
ncbi:MAG: hypothetical protein KF861_24510, partial [Planctomycetaceae bacterium]|nr:hypothetical protein [Planctomycetaceae bacterium]